MDYTNSIKDYIALEIETLKKLNVEQGYEFDGRYQKGGRNHLCIR